MSTKGFKELGKLLTGYAKRTNNPKKALEATGRNAVNAHKRYYRSGSQGAKGGGPPGSKWPGLEPSTIRRKSKRGKTKKLIDTGLLRTGYEHKVKGKQVEIFNREAVKVSHLQVQGVGKKRKRFKVIATDLPRDDPKLMKDSEEILANFIFTGKPTK